LNQGVCIKSKARRLIKQYFSNTFSLGKKEKERRKEEIGIESTEIRISRSARVLNRYVVVDYVMTSQIATVSLFSNNSKINSLNMQLSCYLNS